MTSTNTLEPNQWVIFDLQIGQIKEIDEQGGASFADGFMTTWGQDILERCRPLTLHSKRTVEEFQTIYNRLHEIDGNAGFNYPHIHSYFSQLALDAIDNANDSKAYYAKAHDFIAKASNYQHIIDGIPLFRRNIRVKS